MTEPSGLGWVPSVGVGNLGNGCIYFHPLSLLSASQQSLEIPLQNFTSWAGIRLAKLTMISIYRNVSLLGTACQTLLEVLGDQGMYALLWHLELI